MTIHRASNYAVLFLGLAVHDAGGGEPVRTLFDFGESRANTAWGAVNDGVMGGVSVGRWKITDDKTLLFSGTLSLENNGGFASVRSQPRDLGLAAGDSLVVRVRGDGREYSVNLYTPTNRIAFSDRAPLATSAGKWQETVIPVSAFYAMSFGRRVAETIDAAEVNSIGFLLGDKKAGPFQLEVASGKVRKAGAEKPVPIIFDTDMMGDVDDVGSVALLHSLAANGEVEILAMGLSGKNRWSPLCLDALNSYFQLPKIPISAVRGPAFDRKSRYAEEIAREFPHQLKSIDDTPDAAELYRKVLSQQPDQVTVMVSVGQLTNLANLLKTGPDQYSDLTGPELVRRKVRAWVCMGGKIPAGSEANLIHDGPSAAHAVKHWPTPIIFSGYEIGNKIMTGKKLCELPEQSPVRRAYELYNGLTDRQSWDQTAVLYAARGLNGGLDGFWDVKSGGHLHVNEDGTNVWRETPDKQHSYLVKKMDPQEIADVIEALMMRQPSE
jgi:inosine-uridine nucleoside N-ribohydrolase